MIRKILFVIATIGLTSSIAWGQTQKAPLQKQPTPIVKLEITGVKPIGLRKNPSAMLVTWKEQMPEFVRSVISEVTLVLSGTDVNERVVKSVNPAITSYAVDMSSIPAAKRALVFNGKHFYRADVFVKTKYVDQRNNRFFFVTAKKSTALAPPSLGGHRHHLAGHNERVW